jgi:hypothetical protein
MPYSVLFLIIQSIISSLITVLILFLAITSIPFVSNKLTMLSSRNGQELPLVPLTTTFFGLPIPANEQGMENLSLMLNLNGKVYAKNRSPEGVSITIQTPTGRIFSLTADPNTKIVNGNYDNLEQLLTLGREISIEEVYDLKTRIKQMKTLTIK